MALAKDIPNLAAEVKSRVELDPQVAFTWIESQGQPSEVCDIYDKAVRDLYWLDKGAKNLVIVGTRGLSFCLEQAQRHSHLSQEFVDGFKAQAKTIAYNVAANSWPGWGDDGIVISKAETEVGLEAAKLNLSLAVELKKPADKVAGAYWLLSALELALGKYSESLSSIDRSNIFAQESVDKTVLAYGTAFKGLIYLSAGNASLGQPLLESGISLLKEVGSDDSKYYLSQIEVSKKIFVKSH